MNRTRKPRAYYNPKPVAPLPDGAPRDAVKMEFAKRLQHLMVSKGWNQSELARRTAHHTSDGKFGRDSVSVYIRGMSLPGPTHLNALARALDVKAEELLPSRGVPSVGDSAPPLDVREISPGRVWLKVNQAVDWTTALKVMQLLKGQDG